MSTPLHLTPRFRRAWLPLAAAVVASIVLLLVSPALSDLQAALAREDAARSGVGLAYWFGWYGGVSPGSYSLIVPALSTLIGSLPLLCASTIAIAASAYPLSRRAAHPTLLAWAIAATAVLNMMSGRVAFAVAVAITLGGLVLIQQRRLVAGAAVLVVGGCASALAPAFVGLAVVPFVIRSLHDGGRLVWHHTTAEPTADPPEVRKPDPALWALLIGAAIGVFVPFALFGAPGSQVFPVTTLFWCVLIGVGAWIALRPETGDAGPSGRSMRETAVWVPLLALAVALALFLIPTGVGSNLSRFFCFVLPCLVLYFSPRPAKFLAIALAPALVYSVFVAAADQVAAADVDDPEISYAPLVEQLAKIPDMANHRVELVDAGTHAGSHVVAKTVKLARGWENQSDARYNPIFYETDALTADSYRLWLADNAVAYVAVSAAPMRQARAEAALIEAGLPFLTRTWRNDDWTLYRVTGPTGIVPAPLRLVEESPSRMVIEAPAAAAYEIRIRPNRYLTARDAVDSTITACVTATVDGWTEIRTPAPGRYELAGDVSWRGVLLGEAPECAEK